MNNIIYSEKSQRKVRSSEIPSYCQVGVEEFLAKMENMNSSQATMIPKLMKYIRDNHPHAAGGVICIDIYCSNWQQFNGAGEMQTFNAEFYFFSYELMRFFRELLRDLTSKNGFGIKINPLNIENKGDKIE